MSVKLNRNPPEIKHVSSCAFHSSEWMRARRKPSAMGLLPQLLLRFLKSEMTKQSEPLGVACNRPQQDPRRVTVAQLVCAKRRGGAFIKYTGGAEYGRAISASPTPM